MMEIAHVMQVIQINIFIINNYNAPSKLLVSEIGNLLTDGNVERLVREFIIEHLIVRQTEENWLIIRNKFELRDTEQKKVYGK